jgi:uncharacterized protein (TIGR02231 family)
MAILSRLFLSLSLVTYVCGNIYTIPLGVDIANATVYASNIVELNRFVRLVEQIPVGFHDIVVENFPFSAQDDSLRVMTNQSVEILDLKWSIMEPRRDEAKILELKTKIKTSQGKKAQIELDKSLYDMKRVHLESKMKAMNSYLSTQMTNSASYGTKPLTNTEIVGTLNFTDAVINEIQQDHIRLQTTVRALVIEETQVIDDLKCAESELATLTSTTITQTRMAYQSSDIQKPPNMKQLTLHIRTKEVIEKKEAYPIVFNLRYFASPASWQPSYDIRIDNADPKENEDAKKKYTMMIDYSAFLSQQTNEDWQNVILTLSTSSPQYIDSLPHPERRTVQIQQPGYYRSKAHRGKAATVRTFAAPGMSKESNNNEMFGEAADSMTADGAVPMMGVAAPMMKSMHMVEAESQAMHVSSGDLQSTHLFQIVHRVNLSSSTSSQRINTIPSMYHSLVYTPSSLLDKQKILMEKLAVDVSIFSFAVPSQGNDVFLTAFGSYPNNYPPLLPCSQVKLDIHGTYIGSLAMPGYKPGEEFQVNLGHDANILLTSYDVIPLKQGHEEDKSTWFVTDKKKYFRRFEEKMITVKSLYLTGRHFVLLSENMPSSLETAEEIKVELVAPAPKDCKSFDTKSKQDTGKRVRESTGNGKGGEKGNSNEGGGNGGSLQEEDFVFELLTQELLTPKPIFSPATAAANAMKSEVHHYFSKANNNVYWGIWIAAGDTVRFSYKYQITWPAEKQISVDIA